MTKIPLSLSDVPPLLVRRKWTIAFAGLISTGLAVSASKIVPVYYTSEGDLIVATHQAANSAPDSDGAVVTQVDVLRSHALLARVAHDLHLDSMRELQPALRLPMPMITTLSTAKAYLASFRQLIEQPRPTVTEGDIVDKAVQYMQKYLKVGTTEKSSVIAIKFQAGTPSIAARVVNAIMETYLSNDLLARNAALALADQSLAERAAELRQEVEAAQQQVQAFVATHTLLELQGSTTTVMRVSRVNDQLAVEREVLARQQAMLDTVTRNGGVSAQETLASRTIQALKEREALLIQEIALLAPNDPRRGPIQAGLTSMRAEIASETDKIIASIKRDTEVARSTVAALESLAQVLTTSAQTSSVAAATLVKLKSDVEAKRQIYLDFTTRADQARLAAGQVASARILYQAEPPRQPDHASALMALLFGGIGGMATACGLIFVRAVMNTKINSTNDMALIMGIPVFGSLPEIKGGARRDLLTAIAPSQTTSLVTETLRALWLAMGSVATDRQGITVVVTSSEIGEGKTTVAVALACRVASDGFRVLLIDTDLRCPRVASIFNMVKKRFLESVVKGSVTLEQAVSHDPRSGVDCLLADGSSENPMKVLASEQFEAMIMASRRLYDLVVLDSPPVLRVADAVMLAKFSRHILFIVEAGRMTADLVIEAIRRFAEEDRPRIVPVLSRVRPANLNKRDYYGGYGPDATRFGQAV